MPCLEGAKEETLPRLLIVGKMVSGAGSVIEYFDYSKSGPNSY